MHFWAYTFIKTVIFFKNESSIQPNKGFSFIKKTNITHYILVPLK